MHRLAARVDGDGHRHVLDVEFVDRLHPEVGKADDPRCADRFRDQVRGAPDRHQIRGLVLPDRFDGGRTALALADHRDQAGTREHRIGEFVHPRCRRGAGGPDDFIAHRINGSDVIDDAIAKVHGQRLALIQQFDEALVRGIAAGQQLAVQEQPIAPLPRGDFSRLQPVEVDAPRFRNRRPVHVGPCR